MEEYVILQSSERKKKNKNFLWIILVVVVILGVVGFLFFGGIADVKREIFPTQGNVSFDYQRVFIGKTSLGLNSSAPGYNAESWLGRDGTITLHRVTVVANTRIPSNSELRTFLRSTEGEYIFTGKMLAFDGLYEMDYGTSLSIDNYKEVVVSLDPTGSSIDSPVNVIARGVHTNVDSVNYLISDESSVQLDAGARKLVGYTGEMLAGTEKTPFLDFDIDDYNLAVATRKNIVLYFYSKWCPLCFQEMSEAIFPVFNSLENENVIGFRVNINDLDTDNDERELATKFAVPFQHVKLFFVQGDVKVKQVLDLYGAEDFRQEIKDIYGI